MTRESLPLNSHNRVTPAAEICLDTALFSQAPEESGRGESGKDTGNSNDRGDQQKPDRKKPDFDRARWKKIAGVSALLVGSWGVEHALRQSTKKEAPAKPPPTAAEVAERRLPELRVVDKGELLKRLAQPNDVAKTAYTHTDGGGLIRYEFPLAQDPNSALHVQWFTQGPEHDEFVKALSKAEVTIRPKEAYAAQLQREHDIQAARDREARLETAKGLEALYLTEKILALGFVGAVAVGLFKKLAGEKRRLSGALIGIPGLSSRGGAGDEMADRPVEGFDHIGGIQPVIEELTFLSDEIKRVQTGHPGLELPRGILFYGPPGTGKTMLARALAAETNCPFISFKGSSLSTEFYVGSGLKKIREAFQQARELRDARTEELQAEGKPECRGVCIVFIDEFDSIAQARQSGDWASHEENRVVNTLLTELDNIHKGDDNDVSNKNIVVIAATNDLNSLDPAVIRSGRFNRKIEIPPPQSKLARLDILTKAVRFNLEKNGWSIEDKETSLERLARLTVGDSGADLIGILEKAQALVQRRGDNKLITFPDLMEGFQQQHFGFKMGGSITEEDRRKTAFHELVGHGAMAWACEIATFLISMEPRGKSLGRVIPDPEAMNELMPTKKQLLSRILVNVAGQVAEKVRYGELGATVGNTSDLEQTRYLAKILITTGLVGDDVAESLLDENRHHTKGLSPNHQRLINRAVARAKEAVSEILEAKKTEEWDAIVNECMDLNQELIGDDAQNFLERNLGARPEFRDVVKRVLDRYYADPIGTSSDPSSA
jgi:ATP-dependent Zn protease